jgi:hypothetical protein
MNTLLAELKPATRPAGIWDYVSASRLNLWLRCPLAFRIKYIDRVPSKTTPSLFIGKTVHRGLEIHYRHRQAWSGAVWRCNIDRAQQARPNESNHASRFYSVASTDFGGRVPCTLRLLLIQRCGLTGV